ncbi:ABC transporter substrate-binding protein [Pseudomonas sp. S31]|uniref:ABC transporter substrate-binding protein n=1 Tax=Pseudomonas sp. S31 TaxID=1564473 RepID=UPI0019113402|nr:ABC transporter substrate-binding protein [Pseudomonas sp. S31]MBK4999740.1 ABC transporter substrate-binding protein [Pseudomonas sp. S31]
MSAKQPFYSICPVFVASHISRHLGWLESELAAVDARATGLESHPSGQGAVIHSRHSDRYQIRDGGNVPAISARADHSDTVLIGSTDINQGGQIVVRADAPLWRLADLQGRRIGVSHSQDASRVDWWRANSLRSVQIALQQAGLAADAVHWVDVSHAPAPGAWRSQTPHTSKEQKVLQLAFTPELTALDRGEVDAIYTTQGRAQIYERTGRFKVLENLAASADWVARIATTPYTLVASRALVSERPEVVVAWLRANIRAAQWIKQNTLEAAKIFHEVTYDATVEDVVQVIDGVDFTPSLSPQNLAALDIGKNWLLANGFIHNDFNVAQWAQPQWLGQASASLVTLEDAC